MSTDKRTVSTDALEVLGTIIDDTVGRDAIHLAVEPVIAGEILLRGQHIGLIDGLAYNDDNDGVTPLGIVDPFIEGLINKGDRFLLVVYPRKITSLRHLWTHPEFPEMTPAQDEKEKSKKWLEDFVESMKDYFVDNDYDGRNIGTGKKNLEDLLNTIHDFIVDGFSSRIGAGMMIPDELWHHYEKYTGRKVSAEDRISYFSCSC